ncbi:MAG TPA: rhomboid family intramembrane serine protease [Bryobacteraceae bacterium]|nr:rhomboid family intramembrane serine protease [Bryobacteraceae bacterium]
MCPHCRAFITAKDKICPYCDTEVGPRAIDRRDPGTIFAGMIPAARFVTVLILTLNAGMFLATVLASMKAGNTGALMGLDGRTLVNFGASWPVATLFGGQWWRLLTAGFLHGGLMHIMFNSWAMMDVGAHTEEIYGQRRMVVIYLLSTIGGFLASSFWTRSLSVGASAGLFGLIGAMIAVGVLHKQSMEASMIKAFYIRWAIYGLLMGLLPFFHIDNAAHIGGLATGFITAWIAGTPRLIDTWQEKLWKFLATFLVLLTVLSFYKMFMFMLSASSMAD